MLVASCSACGYAVARTRVAAFGEIVRRSVAAHARSEHCPIRARVLERHADAARIDDARLPDHAIELHVGVTAHDQLHTERVEDRPQRFIGRRLQKNLRIVAGRRVAEQDLANAIDRDRRGQRP